MAFVSVCVWACFVWDVGVCFVLHFLLELFLTYSWNKFKCCTQIRSIAKLVIVVILNALIHSRNVWKKQYSRKLSHLSTQPFVVNLLWIVFLRQRKRVVTPKKWLQNRKVNILTSLVLGHYLLLCMAIAVLVWTSGSM